MIIFENPGEIDTRLITTMGVNVKETPSAIGYFGTGLKYAIAVLLRHKCTIEIHAGQRELAFTVQKQIIRGKEFEFISMSTNGQERELAFTTELGKNWELWMAYRELASNCSDEGGTILTTCPATSPAGLTRILVSGLDQIHADRSKWFLDSKPLFSGSYCSVHPSSGKTFFYKGIRAGEFKEPGLFTYNFTTGGLTEDRTFAAPYMANHYISHAWGSGRGSADDMNRVLLTKKGIFEHNLDFGMSSASEEFLSQVMVCFKRHPALTNQTAVRLLRGEMNGDFEPTPVALTPIEEKILARALAFLTYLGHAPEAEIVLVGNLGDESGGSRIDGLAKNGKIFLTKRCFMMGTKYVASTLLEEHLHLEHDWHDCSRELQSWLFDKVISMGEELRGEPL